MTLFYPPHLPYYMTICLPLPSHPYYPYYLTPGDVLSVGLSTFTQYNMGRQFSFLQNSSGLTYGYGSSGGVLTTTAITTTSSSSSSSSRTLLIAYSWLTQVKTYPRTDRFVDILHRALFYPPFITHIINQHSIVTHSRNAFFFKICLLLFSPP